MTTTISSRPDWRTLTTQQRIEAVKERVAIKASAAQIASDFANCSRQSIIGVCFRYGIRLPNAKPPLARQAAKQSRSPAPRVPARPVRPKVLIQSETPPAPALPPDPSKAVTFLEAISTSTACKWPLWSEFSASALCCGSPRQEDGPYCAYHANIAVGRGTEGERRAARELERHG